MRPSSSSASALLNSSDSSRWATALASYDKAIEVVSRERKLGSRLKEVDQWLLHHYPVLVESRGADKYITLDELVRIMEWKLSRGKDRPMLMSYIKQNSNSCVLSISRASFILVSKGNWLEGVKKMAELKGVGPATASAILTPVFPNTLVFMADEVLEASTGKKREYTLKAYERVREVIYQKSADMGDTWSMDKIGRAMWAAGILSLTTDHIVIEEKGVEKLSGNKRKR